jgi:hypothetical protein
MSAFDYAGEAGLFCAKGSNPRQKGLEYKKFDRAAEAIRFAIESIPAKALLGCTLEVAEETYTGAAIRPLYESPDYPLPRRDGAT